MINEDDLNDPLYTQIQKEIDRDIQNALIVEAHLELGYTKLLIETNDEMESWAKENCKGKFFVSCDTWAFESEQDMTWFILRWSDDTLN